MLPPFVCYCVSPVQYLGNRHCGRKLLTSLSSNEQFEKMWNAWGVTQQQLLHDQRMMMTIRVIYRNEPVIAACSNGVVWQYYQWQKYWVRPNQHLHLFVELIYWNEVTFSLVLSILIIDGLVLNWSGWWLQL